MSDTAARPAVTRSQRRFLLMVLAGLVVGVLVGVLDDWTTGLVAGWAASAGTFCTVVWLRIARYDADATREHATVEDPSRRTTDLLVLVANVASLAAVGFVLARAASAAGTEKAVLAGLVLLDVALSWLLIQTLYTLRYAFLFFRSDVAGGVGGIDFNGDVPTYVDFAYLSFTMGMTFQVSDTNLSSRVIRATVLRHALLSYLFGTVILATTINLVAGLG